MFWHPLWAVIRRGLQVTAATDAAGSAEDFVIVTNGDTVIVTSGDSVIL